MAENVQTATQVVLKGQERHGWGKEKKRRDRQTDRDRHRETERERERKGKRKRSSWRIKSEVLLPVRLGVGMISLI